ncbi:hypothetical protein HYE82_21160 [Streptomyces sp. BR123]|uniref:hypothetical protein n=1 Tax=Streptomyces sp. BR123 TaxID=2749828 RepID=UPI0015C47FC1|nr:hypothetical protein [Streptomyces sp. BR123]NXY96847.1 hypothetical protein [Streptomyces sp. BR123]
MANPLLQAEGMHQREWKPADHRLGVERAAVAILAVAAALFAAAGIAMISVIAAYALA